MTQPAKVERHVTHFDIEKFKVFWRRFGLRLGMTWPNLALLETRKPVNEPPTPAADTSPRGCQTSKTHT